MASIVFKGGNPEALPETEGKFSKWSMIFDLYQYARNPRFGNIEHLPAAGGLLDQPAKTMQALNILVIQYQQGLSQQLTKR